MAYTLAQTPVVANGTGASISKAFASTVTAHSLLIAMVTTDQATPGTFSATGGGTWASVGSKKDSGSGQWVSILYCLDATGGTAPTVQVSWTGIGAFNGLLLAEFTNSGVASVLDASTAGTTGVGTTVADSAMTATAADLVIGFAVGNAAGFPTAPGSGFTIGPTSDTTDITAWEYRNLAGAGSVTASMTCTSQSWGIISAAFAPSGGGGGAAVPPSLVMAPRWN